jgi:hypothetical protein
MHLRQKIIFLCTNSVDNFVNKNLNMRLTPLQIRILLFCLKFKLHKTVNNHHVAYFTQRICEAKIALQSGWSYVHKFDP